MNVRFVWSFLFFFFLSFCTKDKAPDWYTNPTINNNNFYGIGFSTINYEDAKRKALIDITGQIQTNITATIRSTVNKTNNELSKSFTQTATARVDNLEINNYNIEKQFANDSGFYILLSLNKQDFIKFLENDISFKMQSLKTSLITLKDENVGKKLIKIKDLKSEIESIREKDFILRILNVNYDLKKYQDSILELEKEVNSIKDNVVFFIDCSDSKIRAIFSQALIQGGYKIESSLKKEDRNIIILKIEQSAQEMKIFNSFIAKISLSCHFKDSTGEDFFFFLIEKNGMSVSGKTQAQENLYLVLRDYLRDNLTNILSFYK